MSTATLASEEEYVSTTYRPDCDYVDGVLMERNVGQLDHSDVQRALLVWFHVQRAQLRLVAFPELRVAVGPRRYRVPDVCVVQLPKPTEQILSHPPYICIEILSPDDSFPRLQERFDDYLNFGVANVWVIDPASRRAWQVTREGHLEALDGILRSVDSRVELPIADLFLGD